MLKVRKIATALVLGLVMCLALFGTGAFAQGIGIATSNAAAGGDGFGGLFHDFGFLNGFFGPDAVASSTAIGLGLDCLGGFGL
jgi:hypothetical protein